jgi:hypothetical protein
LAPANSIRANRIRAKDIRGHSIQAIRAWVVLQAREHL